MKFEKLTNYLEQIDKNLIPDCRLLVYKDHQCLYDKAFTKFPLQPEKAKKDMYYIFSASKVITCTAALRLVQDGKLDLDDPVYKYLPEFKNLYIEQNGERVLAKNTLTVRHLFSMQGGLTYNLEHQEIKKMQAETNNKATTRQMMYAIAKMPLIFEPGESFAYSLCHDVLAAVVEIASGKRFSEYLKEIIFEPLKMESTTLTVTDEVKARLKQQYAVDKFNCIAVEKEADCPFILSDYYESGGAGIITTAEDYIKFADALACESAKDGYAILNKDYLQLLQTNQLKGAAIEAYHTSGARKMGYGYALGVRTLMDPIKADSRSPIGEFGWNGAAGAYCMIDTKNHISIYFAQHVMVGVSAVYMSSVQHAIKNIVYEVLES